MNVFKGSKVFIDQKDEWTPKVLEERQRQIIDLLAKRP
ncbi:hypothetical protein KN10_0893 [Anoxybacillus flavithermus NBRC 109594]|uniref:Uncharacterized protein n=1 Tax=Anoxybacillus flavithermus NBRC 109594 TaxID=1315967 RepID=R4G678_9BACL|nr:hypothetical protein KN10_0893 [Anoxybacillus flavithermus NBRC 109594]